MTGRSLFALLTILCLPAAIIGWDQLVRTPFRIFFPFVDEKLVDQLTIAVNRQNTTNQSIQVLNDWIDANWVTPSTTPKPPAKNQYITSAPYYGRLIEKEYTRGQARGFLEYRGAVKMIIRFMFRTTQLFGYLNETEAEMMRKTFWEADEKNMNDWSWAKNVFYSNVQEQLGKRHPGIADELQKLANVTKYFPGVGEKLAYRLIR